MLQNQKKLKSTLLFITITFILFLLPVNTMIKAAPTTNQLIFIAVNDELVEFPDAKPIVVDGVTFVPVRALATLVKADIFYNEMDNSFTLTKGFQSIKINLNDKTSETKSNEKLPIDIQSVKNRTLLPLRFIAEYLQLNITYFEQGQIARLIDKQVPVQLTDEQLYQKFKDQIEKEKQKWALSHNKENRNGQQYSHSAFLTFDDGPNKNSAAILDILQKYNVQATFFMVEPKVRKYQDEVKRMVAENHMIASHSVTHDKNKVYRSPDALLNEMNKTRETLLAITGVDSSLVRVPYGSKPYLKEHFRDKLAKNEIKVWDWNVDSNDWRYSDDAVLSTVKKQVQNLKQKNIPPVILFHDKANTAEVLPEIIEFLQNEGYALKAYNPDQHFIVNFWNDERL